MDTRQKIILTAYQTFYKQGFHACGVELLAQNAGVTKRTLYAHFGSKDGLIAAVLEYRHLDFLEKMQAALNEQSKQQTAEAYLQFIDDWTKETDFCGCLFLHACAEYTDPNSEPYRIAQAHKSEIRRLLQERLSDAHIVNAKMIADRAFLIGEGIISTVQTGQNGILQAFDLKSL
ncbi:TetR/AcrR family transcriptional regulator [Neisseria weixii]|uniref:TetR/AcrR family transcriptional regulator n=1 Tax=Neisseria weixii TaxID=1853276 RepID=UPI0035A1D27E